MDEDSKKTIAVFRFGVIADLVGGRKLNRGEKEFILREKSSSRWEIPFSPRSHISRSTILSWVRAYERGGRRIESLYPDERKDKGRYRPKSTTYVPQSPLTPLSWAGRKKDGPNSGTQNDSFSQFLRSRHTYASLRAFFEQGSP